MKVTHYTLFQVLSQYFDKNIAKSELLLIIFNYQRIENS